MYIFFPVQIVSESKQIRFEFLPLFWNSLISLKYLFDSFQFFVESLLLVQWKTVIFIGDFLLQLRAENCKCKFRVIEPPHGLNIFVHVTEPKMFLEKVLEFSENRSVLNLGDDFFWRRIYDQIQVRFVTCDLFRQNSEISQSLTSAYK